MAASFQRGVQSRWIAAQRELGLNAPLKAHTLNTSMYIHIFTIHVIVYMCLYMYILFNVYDC